MVTNELPPYSRERVTLKVRDTRGEDFERLKGYLTRQGLQPVQGDLLFPSYHSPTLGVVLEEHHLARNITVSAAAQNPRDLEMFVSGLKEEFEWVTPEDVRATFVQMGCGRQD